MLKGSNDTPPPQSEMGGTLEIEEEGIDSHHVLLIVTYLVKQLEVLTSEANKSSSN